MASRLRVFGSSVGTKILIGVTGLALFLYLLIHIAGNLLVFLGPAFFNQYAYTLEGNPLMPIIEIGLLLDLPHARLQDGDDVSRQPAGATGALRAEGIRRTHRAARASRRRR